MQPQKYTSNETTTIDLGTKVIYKYPTPLDQCDVGKMVIHGRHPVGANSFIVEHECSFIMYILSGNGRVYAGDTTFEVKPEDVVFVPHGNQFAVEGDFSYITFDTPAYFPDQSEEITVNSKGA